jgi:hypothetical protein
MLPVVLTLGRNPQRQLVSEFERARLAERRKDLELVGRAGIGGVIAPEKALDRKPVGAIVAVLGIRLRHDRFEHLQRSQPFRLRITADTLAPEGESQQALARLIVAVERDHHGACSSDRLGLELSGRCRNAHYPPRFQMILFSNARRNVSRAIS